MNEAICAHLESCPAEIAEPFFIAARTGIPRVRRSGGKNVSEAPELLFRRALRAPDSVSGSHQRRGPGHRRAQRRAVRLQAHAQGHAADLHVSGNPSGDPAPKLFRNAEFLKKHAGVPNSRRSRVLFYFNLSLSRFSAFDFASVRTQSRLPVKWNSNASVPSRPDTPMNTVPIGCASSPPSGPA